MLRLAAIPLLLGITFAAPHGQARGGMSGMGMHFGMFRDPETVEALGLSEDQQQKLEDLYYSHQETALNLRQKMERGQLEMQKLMDADNPNENQIKAKTREIGALRTDMQLEKVEFFFKVRGVLTAEQVEKLKTLRPRMGGAPGRGACRDGEGPSRGNPGPSGPQD